ncbi:unnamed protein product [Caenorhabditis brenneri]
MGSTLSRFSCVPWNSRREDTEDLEDDLFKVQTSINSSFKLVFSMEDNDVYIKKYELDAKWAMIVMDVDGQDHMDVMYRGKKYVFNLVLVEKIEDIGKLDQLSPLVANFYYGPQHNRFQFLRNRIYHIIRPTSFLSLRFNDPNRDIRIINFDTIHFTYSVEINKPSVSAEELDYIGHIQFLHILLLNTEIPLGYEAFALKYRIAYIAHAERLTLAQLETVQCHYLFIGKSSFTSTDMNHFMKSWMNKKLSPDFYMLHIKEFQKTEDLYQGIDFKLWDPEVRNSRYRIFDGTMRLDLSTSFDITREDGTVASFYPWSKNIFHFSVWFLNHFPVPPDVHDFDLNTPPELVDYSYWRLGRASFIVLECIFGRSFENVVVA